MKKLYSILSSRAMLASVAGVMGAFVFLLYFGTKTLDVTNVQWLMSGGDLNQHYLGWLFYRLAEWTFPIGNITSLAYPYGISVTYMDAIPLLAIPFKTIGPLLPESFQYFGWWGLGSYVLQGSLAFLILHTLTRRRLFALLGSTLFVLSPILLARMFSHTALAGSWVILLAFWLLLAYKTSSSKKFMLAWSAVLAISAAIHPYFVPMNLAVFAVALILRHTSIAKTLVEILVPPAVMAVFFWIIGGFSAGSVSDLAAGGLGAYGMNLNALVNPLGWSTMLPNLPTSPGSYEGMAYLGLGGIIVTTLAIIAWLVLWKQKQLQLSISPARLWLIIGVITIVLFAAIAPIIHFGSKQLAIPLPYSVEAAWSIFRANGRLVWPVYYAGFFLALWLLAKFFLKKPLILYALSVVIIGVQFIDIYSSYAARDAASRVHKTHTLPSPPGIDAILSNKRHMQYLIEHPEPQSFFNIAYFATRHSLTMSNGYFARKPVGAIEATRQAALANVQTGNLKPDTVYIADNGFLENNPQLANDANIRMKRFDTVWLLYR